VLMEPNNNNIIIIIIVVVVVNIHVIYTPGPLCFFSATNILGVN
jgi:hypothetical protein